MKIYVTLLALFCVLNAGTYDENYDVFDATSVNKNYDVLMDGEFKEVIRFDELYFEDEVLNDDSNITFENISKKIKTYVDSNNKILISIIGFTDRKTDDINELKVESKTYANRFQNLFSYSLSENETIKLSENYAQSIATKLAEKGFDKNLMIVEYRGGKDNLSTLGSSDSRAISRRVMIAIYVYK